MAGNQTSAWYKFENNYDDSGSEANANTLSNVGTGQTYSTGTVKVGTYSLSLNGSGGVRKLNPTGLATGNSSYSIAVWFNPSVTPSSGQYKEIVQLGDYDISGAIMSLEYTNPSGTVTIDLIIGTSRNSHTITLSTGTWYHLVGTYNSTNQAYALYIDGVAVKTGTNGSTLNMTYGGGGGVCVGVADNGANVSNAAFFDDVRIYDNYCLNATEVSQLYNSGAGTNSELSTSLISYLRSCYLFGSTVTADNEGNHTLTNSGVTSDTGTTKVESTSGRFDGADHMEQPAVATNSLSEYTLAFWVKGDATNVQYNMFGKNSATDRCQMAYSPSTGAYFQTGGTTETSASGLFTATDWNHFMCASDGTNIYLIINGVVRGKIAEADNFSASGNLFLGHNSLNTNERLAGYMSQFSLWTTCLDGISGKNEGDSVTGLAANLYNSGTGLARASWTAGGGAATDALFLGGGF